MCVRERESAWSVIYVSLWYAYHIQRLSAHCQAFLPLIRPGIIILWNGRNITGEYRLNTNWMSIDLPSSNLCFHLQCTIYLNFRECFLNIQDLSNNHMHIWRPWLCILIYIMHFSVFVVRMSYIENNRSVKKAYFCFDITDMGIIVEWQGFARYWQKKPQPASLELLRTLNSFLFISSLFFSLFSSIRALFLCLTSTASLAVGYRLLGTRGAVWKRLMSFLSWPLI